MVSLWKYPKCPPNGDEEMDPKYKSQGQVKKYSCSDSLLRGRCGGEEIRGAELKVKNSSRTTLCLTSTAFEDILGDTSVTV